MKPDGDLIAADVDELLTDNDWLAAMPTAAGPRGRQPITYPFGDAKLIEPGQLKARLHESGLLRLSRFDNSLDTGYRSSVSQRCGLHGF